MQAQISVIIPTCNRLAILKESLDFLFQSVKKITMEVIVVNDGEEPTDELKNYYPEIALVKNAGSGVAAARNTGVAISNCDIILLMDDDMWVSEEALSRIIKFHSQHECTALNLNWVYPNGLQEKLQSTAFGRYLKHFGFVSLEGWCRGSLTWIPEKVFPSNGITSQNLSMERSLFDLSGGYEEEFPFAGFEDYAYSKKLANLGIKSYIDPTIITFHNEADRISITSWLDRKFRGSITRRVAVDLGYSELAIPYPTFKKCFYRGIGLFSPLLRKFVTGDAVNNSNRFDPISFFIINALLAESIYRGYTFKKP